MKLLKRSTLNTEVASQRKAQIDEGIIIAKKVDTLRQTLASLELQQKTFLSGMETELRKSTQHLIEEIALKKRELEELKVERTKLLEPLDKAWSDVRIKEKEILASWRVVETKEKNVDGRKTLLETKLAKAKESLFKIRTIEREIKRAYDDMEVLKAEAEDIKLKSLTDRDNQTREFEVKMSNLSRLEEKNKNDEIALTNLRELLDNRTLELNDREKAVNDKYSTLERTINRLNK